MKSVLLQSNFETRSKLNINLYIMGHPFSMYTVIDYSTSFLLFALRLEMR